MSPVWGLELTVYFLIILQTANRLRSFSTFVQGGTIVTPHRKSGVGIGLVALVLVFLTGAIPSASVAHDIASDVTIQAFVKPEGQRLLFLVRVPLEALQQGPP